MRVAPIAAGVACLAACAALPAEAATPTANGRYQGRTSQGRAFPVQLRMADSTTSVQRLSIAWRARKCDLAANGTQGTVVLKNVKVSSAGRLSKRKKTTSKLPSSGSFSGGKQVATVRVKGRFTTARKITGTLRADVRVLNSAGQEIDHCVTPRPIKWSASFIGVTDPGDYTLP